MVLESMGDRDIPEFISLYEEHLNSGVLTEESVRAAFHRGEYYGFRAVSEGRTGGIFTIVKGIVLTYPHPELDEEIQAAVGEEEIFTCDALLVLPDCRERGVARRLAAKSRDFLLNKGIKRFFAESWIYPDGSDPGLRVFESMGRPILKKHIPLFYKDLDKYGMTCPICGVKCVCGAWIEVLDLTEAGS
ncbi:MAG: hypothetical protein K5989_04500 [Lachnospiraceae bacterium]|nr:hypothetical protein [Lachnospiraceae bacterium]